MLTFRDTWVELGPIESFPGWPGDLFLGFTTPESQHTRITRLGGLGWE